MKLLQTEIDIEPGRKPQKQALPEGWVGQGTAVVRLKNNTNQENAYKVRVRCDNPYWQETWASFAALPPSGSENAPPAGKPDQYGPNNSDVTVYVTRGGERDVMVLFDVPRSYDARAGLYRLVIQVETRVVGPTTGLRRKERFTELKAVGIIRPFYAWSSEITPETRKVGFFRRSADFELVLVNEGNDWLYCDLRQPKPKDVLIEMPSTRIAVPPPEPGQERSVRTIPVRGISKVRAFRGERQPMPLPLTVARVEAPTVAPLPDVAKYEPASANCHAAVVEDDTQDLRLPQNDKALINCPLFPATLSGCLGAIAQNGKGLIMTIIGLIVAANLAVFMFEQLFRNNIVAEPYRSQVAPGGVLTMGGRWLHGARVFIDDDPQPAELAKPVENEGVRNTFSNLLRAVHPAQLQLIGVRIPESYDGKRIRLTVQRAGALPFLGPLLPKHKCGTTVQVGTPKKEPVPAKKSLAFVPPTVTPKQQFTIRGQNLGNGGRVMFGNEPAAIKKWQSNYILAVPPSGMPLNEPIEVNVWPENREEPIWRGTIKIVDPTAQAAAQPGGPGGSAPASGGGTPTGQAPAGGGTATGGGGTARPPIVTQPPRVTPAGASGAYAAILRGDDAAAASAINSALAANANDPLALALKGYALLRDERAGDARGPIAQALRLSGGGSGRTRAVALTASAWLSEVSNDATSAERQYRAAIDADKTCVLAYYSYTYFLLDNNRRMEAVEQVRAALRQNAREARGSRKFMELAGKLGIR
ncbi:MAG: hypothetical protein GX446_06975 [Chthonomonadales bacterium]|nr:hypothetical protein [Chthonomonadales bacterium]